MKRSTEGKCGVVIFSLIGVIAVLVSTGLLFLSPDAPLLPVGDHTDILVYARAMLNHASILYNHDLGFPVGADRYFFPRPDYWELLTLWLGARLTNNVFGAVMFFYAVSIPLIFLSCFFSLLWLRIERIPALLMAWAYCLLPFAADRFSNHDYYAVYFAAPFGAALALHLGRIKTLRLLRQTVFANAAMPFAVVAYFAIAWSDVYFAFFSCFFIGLSGFFITAGNRRIEPLTIAVGQIAIISLLFVVGMLPYLLRSETFPLRGPIDQYYAATRIPDILNLFSHVHWLAEKYQAYSRYVRPHSEGADFWPGFVLSIITLLSPLSVFAMATRDNGRQILWDTRVDVIVLAAVLISVAILFSLPESYGYLFNMLVNGTIRAQNRCGVFVAFFSLVILYYLFSWLQSRVPKWRRTCIGVMAALLLANAWPQLGYAWRTNYLAKHDTMLQADLVSIRAALTALHHAHAHNVLQLPVAGWPEVPNIGRFAPYNHLLFYILDAPQSSIKWSYGIDWHQPEYQGLKTLGTALEATPDIQTWMPFRCLGFDTVIVEKAAYSPTAIEKIEMSLTNLGTTKPLFEDTRRAVFSLGTLSGELAVCPQSG